MIADGSAIRRKPYADVVSEINRFDYLGAYCEDLVNALNLKAVRDAGVHIGADPMGGASVQYWGYIAENLGIDLTVVNPKVDPTWSFMTLDTDGKIRMDCPRPTPWKPIGNKEAYDIATGNDADADRHGIVTPDAGLMNPNAYLAVAIQYLYANRPGGDDAGIGKTLVSSSMIDRVAESLAGHWLRCQLGSNGSCRGCGLARSASAAKSLPAHPSSLSTAAPGPPTRTASCSPCWQARSRP